MCLDTRLPSKEKNEITKDITKNGLTVYKVVRTINGRYYPLFNNIDMPFEEGTMEADTTAVITIGQWVEVGKYKSGFHFWLNKKDATTVAEKILIKQKENGYELREQFRNTEITIIQCIVKKSWITLFGMDTTNNISAEALVAKKAIFPKYGK